MFHLFFYPVKDFLFDVIAQLRSAFLDDAAIHEHMDEVRLEIVEHTLLVGDDHGRCQRRAELIETFRHDAEGIDVEA